MYRELVYWYEPATAGLVLVREKEGLDLVLQTRYWIQTCLSFLPATEALAIAAVAAAVAVADTATIAVADTAAVVVVAQ